MSETLDAREKLQQRIREKKGQIEEFLRKTQPRSDHLTIASIVCAGLAGLLTAGPAAGGPSFTQAITQAIGTTSPSWRLLCAVATILSFIATTALAVHKIQDLTNKVTKAQTAYAKLEGLETLLETTDLSTAAAADQFGRFINEVPFALAV
ncbi:MAG: hypothetical protein M0036_20910 [Desulfobacteraceae bacterium]|nr:hypothetical protein [Desulfobacteraceae bacterium]